MDNTRDGQGVSALFAGLSFPMIVLDLEWNQHYGKQRGELPQEILEIGAVKLDGTFAIRDQLGLLVRPQVHTRLHHHVRRITGISSAESKGGLSFPEAAAQLSAFCGPEYTLCTWGRDDLPVLWKNYAYWRLPMPTFRNAVNLQMAYDHLFTGTPSQQVSLAGAMEALSITPELPAHRALHDAYHTALILREMNKRLLEKELDPKQIQALRAAFAEEVLRLSERKTVTMTKCRRLTEALADASVSACTCPLCNGELSHQTPMFPVGRSQKFQQLSACKEHGEILTQLQAQRQQGGYYRLLQRSTLTTPERAEKVRRNYLLQPPPKRRKRKQKKAPAGTEAEAGS